jgi:hypothetical protein
METPEDTPKDKSSAPALPSLEFEDAVAHVEPHETRRMSGVRRNVLLLSFCLAQFIGTSIWVGRLRPERLRTCLQMR